MSRHLRRQIVGYVLSGILATGTDFISYNLITMITENYSIAKAISFLLGTVVAYFYNKFITFGHTGKSIGEVVKFLILYCSSMIFNIGVNKIVLTVSYYYSSPTFFKKTVAFLVATFISMVINFCGQKFWVFRSD